jgi:hypothetical protein
MFLQGIGTALLEVYHAVIAHLIAGTVIAQDSTGQPYTESSDHRDPSMAGACISSPVIALILDPDSLM